MKIFNCQCGVPLFFENTHCEPCGRKVGYDAGSGHLFGFDSTEQGLQNEYGNYYRMCQNYVDYRICNWVLDINSPYAYCLSCRLNQLIPSLSTSENMHWWSLLEAAKRRLVYTLLQFGLPVEPQSELPAEGLGFAFVEDQRSNPDMGQECILTGYAKGLITINLLEADVISREWHRVSLGEPYRTLLGHFRHESGHYYFDRLIKNSHHINTFHQLFGDEHLDYESAIARYYANEAGELGEPADERYISRYASAHPLEDWAECWAHYLHMMDSLDTAVNNHLVDASLLQADFHQQVDEWIRLAVVLNNMNRSMGLSDTYPFVISSSVIEKLRLVHHAVTGGL